MIDASVELGESMAKLALVGFGQHEVQSYGKGGIVGLAGEQEHANALLTTAFANPIRAAIGGGESWISSFTKKGGPDADRHSDEPQGRDLRALALRRHVDRAAGRADARTKSL